MPPSAAVTSVRTSLGNELLPPEAQAAVAALASLNPEFCGIDKHRRGTLGAEETCLLGGLYANVTAILCLPSELHRSADFREQRVVISETDVLAGVELCSPLADQDLAGLHELAVEPLHAQAAPGTIAPIG